MGHVDRLRRELSGHHRVIETHASLVFLGPDEVLKIKKPVDLGFLDFSTLERRRDACEAEVRLNRRLAPGVYLGVVPIVPTSAGLVAGGRPGEAVEWAVRMNRLDDAWRADRRLEAENLSAADVDRLADTIAEFHATARCDEVTTAFGDPTVIARNLEENFAQTGTTIGRYVSPAAAREVRRWQRGFLAEHRGLFEQRMAAGRVRDGHGDLRLEHVYFRPEGTLAIIDCIEFNERFRYADVSADLAFLGMDLAWHRRVDLAERLLARYARATGDYDLYPLVDFYESYRAFVRGKVSSFLALDESLPGEVRERADQEARRYFTLALASERRSLLDPWVVAIGGPIGAGKSTLAEQVGVRMGAPVISSDRTRKELLDEPLEANLVEEPWSGAYAPEVTTRVYAELVRRGDAVLSSGRSVVFDASFRGRDARAAVRELARTAGRPWLLVEAWAPAAELHRRLAGRSGPTARASDGRPELLEPFLAAWEPFDELGPEEHLVIDTTRPLARCLEQLEQRLPFWPRGLTD